MRVAIEVRVDSTSGGVQQWIVGLAHALSGLKSVTEEYVFLVDSESEEWLKPYLGGQCRLLRRPATTARWVGWTRDRIAATTPWVRDLWQAIGLGKSVPPSSDGVAERLGVDVVHFPQQTAYLTSLPTVYQPWDLQHLHLPDFFTADEFARRERNYRAHCEKAGLVITATDWVKRDVAEHYAIPLERIAVVGVPPPTAAYTQPTEPEVVAISLRLGLPSRFIFYPAQAWPHKNHVRLLEALALLRAEGLRIPLVCSGHRNERHAELELHAERLGIAADVIFLGFVDSKELLTLYRRARTLVFPSLYEGWGIPIVEAFAQGLPVACSNVTSLPELVGDAALVFNPDDPFDIAAAVRQLWMDDALSSELAHRGQSVVARYDWHQTALLMRAHYKRVAGRPLDDEDLEAFASARMS